jgi:hypothetical protein
MGSARLIQHFDGESGRPTVSMTFEQAQECSHQGPCDSDVERNLDKVMWHATDNEIRSCLRNCGAWDDLAVADTATLRSRMLWVAACDIAENRDIYDH